MTDEEAQEGKTREKEVLAAASFYSRKIYENPDFARIPKETMREAKAMCARLAEKIRCIFLLGFYENGSLFFEARSEGDGGFDDALARREIKDVKKRENELIRELRLWYVVFRTEEGRLLEKALLKGEDYE